MVGTELYNKNRQQRLCESEQELLILERSSKELGKAVFRNKGNAEGVPKVNRVQ